MTRFGTLLLYFDFLPRYLTRPKQGILPDAGSYYSILLQ